MIKVLLTGAGGQLGKAVIKAAANTPKLALFSFNSKQLNITDAEQVKRVFESIKPDFCINCAAYTQVDLAEAEPDKAFAVNELGVQNLAQTAAVHPCFIVLISTDYVFDGTKNKPYFPEDSTAPINV
ncbi:MAG: sugar nucleotide-binding protein, partial [Flavobacteriaceae bacterium]|nr:sugar nucleotide-binding protein [Flavobacteriaceae bacterium]